MNYQLINSRGITGYPEEVLQLENFLIGFLFVTKIFMLFIVYCIYIYFWIIIFC